jgi:tRNA/tmRNA/rRNA uracil-C5-methylase (TrmA/RlmC/RlmD family)
MPWSVMQWLNTTLNDKMRVFEWGSGGSTIYMAKRVASIISVEHDREWVTVTKQEAKLHSLTNIEFVHHPFEIGKQASIFSSGHVEHQGEDYEKYCRSIEDFEDESFDLVVIDGRARMGCLQIAKNKVRIGGYIVVDDTDRARYQKNLTTMNTFDRIEISGAGPYAGITHKTSIFKRKE